MIGKNFLLLFCFCFLNLNAQSKADNLLGNWLATDNSVAVEVYKLKGEYRAKVLWFDDTKGSGKPMHMRFDTENPDPKMRSRKIIGMEILEGLKYNPDYQSWENGRIYDATCGKYWDSSASLTKDGILKVRGFWKFKWIGKSMSFKKINNTTFTKL